MVRIRFASEQDEEKGFYLLATNARLRGLPGGLYEVSKTCLALLDQHSIRYTVIPPGEISTDDAQATRNPLAVEL